MNKFKALRVYQENDKIAERYKSGDVMIYAVARLEMR